MRKWLINFFFILSFFEGAGQRAFFSKIDSLISDAHYDDATKLIAEAAKVYPDARTAALLDDKTAEILITQGKLEEAGNVLQRIQSSGDLFVEAVTQTNLGFLNLNRGRSDLALENLQHALSGFTESGNQNTKEAALCLADLCLVYWSTGKLNQAEESGLIALQLRQRLFGEASESVAASYNDLGLVYSQSDIDKALGYYEKALSVYKKLHGADHPKIAQANINIGILYRKSKLYGDAVNNFESAEAIWTKNYPQGHPNQALTLVNLGITYQQMGDKKAALGYFEKALAMYQKSYGAKHPDIAYVYNQLGLINLGNSHYDEALRNFQEAVCANSPGFDKKTISMNPKVNDYYNGKVLLYSLHFKAQALEARHYGKTLKFDDLKLALATLNACDTLIDDIRHHSADQNDKIELGESANEVYEDGVRIAEAMSEISVDYKHYRTVAFYFAEKSKAAVLQESIADAEAKSFAGIPSDLLEEEKKLKSDIAFVVQKLSQKPSPKEEESLRQSLFGLNQKYGTFIRNLENDYPNYFNLKFNQSPPSIRQLQKLLDHKTCIISYFIAEKGKRIYQFIITQKTFRIKNLTLPDDFDKLMKGLTNSLLFSEMTTYHASASVLSRILIPRLPQFITDLVIIPSGRLGTIPFEALSYHRNKASEFKFVPFVVKRFATSYEFSAGLLTQRGKTINVSASPSIFLCAPVTFPPTDNLDDLPGTEREVKTIAALFSPNVVSMATFDNASEELVKSGKLAGFKYLHFATHGIVNETNPELSQIFLHPGAKEDGNLFSGEIYNLNLTADLAVLSACQTGLGKFSNGEGVIGLSRALVYAGAKNIVVTFWSVADESTSQLMADFYRIMLKNKNQNFRETLQQAKLKMIKEGIYSAPYYWAPFILIGF